MYNKLLFIIVVILVPIAVISFNKKETNFNLSKNNKTITILLKNNDNIIEEIELETYVAGVVAAEMPASFHEEALKAQAVAARTFAYYKMSNNNNDYDLVANISDQEYLTIEEMQEKWQGDFNKYYTKIINAINDTKGLILTYNNEVIESYYFAMSNGYTEDASLVFLESEPYLVSVESSWDNNVNNFEVTTTFSKKDFCTKLNISCDYLNIDSINRSSTHRVNNISINSKEFKGTDFRKLLSLRSTDFNIDIKNDLVLITTYGYGHGVGMSQYGANGMAKSGYSYDEILKYFYKDVEISKI